MNDFEHHIIFINNMNNMNNTIDCGCFIICECGCHDAGACAF